MRSIGVSLVTMGLTAAVIGNAYYQKKQFYPSVVYITKSNPSMAVIYIQSMVLVLMLGKLMRKIFLGTLRAAEFEHLMERFWYALTETCLAFTVFRDDFNPKFIALFTVLLFLKSFHWLAEDRVDYMERSPVIGWLFHIRVAGLVNVLGILDFMMISHAYYSTISKGASVQLVFGFEYAILITMVANTTIKYILHATELRSESPWENKAVFLLYTELIIGLIRVVLYILFVVIMVRIYTLPLFAFRPMYYTIRNFKKALNDVILSRRAIRNMNTLYPDATAEELHMSDNICIICREDMVSHSKKLPCGHIFHTACLRSWFQRQQTCPTCRLNILRTPVQATPAAPQAARIVPNAANRPAAAGNQPATPNVNAATPGQVPPAGAPVFPPNIVPGSAATATGTNTGATITIPSFLPPPITGAPMANFPMMTPYLLPPPPMPSTLASLTDEELTALEGTERRHVEARIKLLRNIQTMLDASVALMNQYTAINAQFPLGNDFAAFPSTPAAAAAAAATPSAAAPEPSASTSGAFAVPGPSGASAEKPPHVEEETTSQVKTTRIDENVVKLEDIGSEEPSSNNEEAESNTTSFAGIYHVPEESSEKAELRQRRLQKFQPSDGKGDTKSD
ncbi:E3 ubiquitin-protein ligase HRD1 [Phlebotomus argentipes]|uniref:E3 ubiquitin-protein ligase HRD1 n=1 Tax=Phlebotomus argentipes TaxID=94469 RepID=UPI00289371DB|nr:E3 ubiquitin-protein ligase HRD1 [Phlebotomus argentipes]